MAATTFYVLDPNVYIHAGRDYHSLDLCDTFWQHLVTHGDSGRVVSIDRIKAELTVRNNPLCQWVAVSWPIDWPELKSKRPVAPVRADALSDLTAARGLLGVLQRKQPLPDFAADA